MKTREKGAKKPHTNQLYFTPLLDTVSDNKTKYLQAPQRT